MTENQEKILDAIREGAVRDIHALAKAAAIKNHKIAQNVLSRLIAEGVVTVTKLNPRRFDWSSLRVAGETARARKKPGPKLKTAKSPASRRKLARASKRTVRSPAAIPPTPNLEDCISVTYTPAEVVALVELEGALQGALAKVSEIVTALRNSPALGPKGAAAMQFLATMLRDEATPARGRPRAIAKRSAPTSAPASKGSDEEQ